MTVCLTTLGSPKATLGGAPLTELPAQRLRFAVLIYLAVERRVGRDDLLAIFWPDRETTRGRHALRQLLYELRQVLGDSWIEMSRDQLRVTDIAVDALDFETAVESDHASDALRLYRGGFLSGFTTDSPSFDAWADRRRAHYGRLYRRLQRAEQATCIAAGSPEAALALARQWVETDPLDDEAAHALIVQLATLGNRTEALRFYDSYERELQSALQVEPLDETRALIERIRSGEPMTGARGADPIAPLPGVRPAPQAPESASQSVSKQATSPDQTTSPEQTTALKQTTPWKRSTSSVAVRRAYLTGAAGLALLFAIAALVWGPLEQASANEATPRIAVLPFDERTPDAELAPLAAALTEHVAHGLARSAALEVVGPNGVAWLRSRGTPEDSLGLLLGAHFLVAGSLTRTGDWLRVDVELLDARTGRIIRGAAVERPWDDSRILVEDVVERVATVLRREVGTWITVQGVRAQTSSEEAWRLVIEARALMNEPIARLLRQREFAAAHRELTRADSLLSIAAAADPGWATPLVERGRGLERRAFIARMEAPADKEAQRALLDEALDMAGRALERDAGHAAAHELRGMLLYELPLRGALPADSVQRGLAMAEAALRRATVLEPERQRAWRILADVLSQMGRYAESKNAALRAYQLDPYAEGANTLVNLLFTTSLELGEDHDAETWCTYGRRRFQNELPFLYCLLALHAWADGVKPDAALLRRELHGFQQLHLRVQPQLQARLDALIATAHARAGESDSARAVLRRLAAHDDDVALLWMRAGAHTALNEDTTALRLLERYLTQGQWSAPRVARGRAFLRLRDNADYRRLVGPLP